MISPRPCEQKFHPFRVDSIDWSTVNLARRLQDKEPWLKWARRLFSRHANRAREIDWQPVTKPGCSARPSIILAIYHLFSFLILKVASLAEFKQVTEIPSSPLDCQLISRLETTRCPCNTSLLTLSNWQPMASYSGISSHFFLFVFQRVIFLIIRLFFFRDRRCRPTWRRPLRFWPKTRMRMEQERCRGIKVSSLSTACFLLLMAHTIQ